MPQGGRQPPSRKKAAPVSAAAEAQHSKPGKTADTDKEWQRSSGAFSGAAKKDYLKWKRQQKAARGDSSSDEEPVQQQRSHQQQPGRMPGSPARQQQAPVSQPQHQHHQQLQRAPPNVKDAAEPLRYRPLAAVPAAPFSMSAHHATSTSTAPGSTPERAGPAAGAQTCAGVGLSADMNMVSSSQQEGEESALAYMPRLDPAEVGFTSEGFKLDMPTRPKWQVGAQHAVLQL